MAAKNPTLDSLRAAPGRKKLSVIVTTFNEEINVAECLESVLWADEILLVDSFSTDRTVEIARTFPITGWRFLSIGRRIERLSFICQALETALHEGRDAGLKRQQHLTDSSIT